MLAESLVNPTVQLDQSACGAASVCKPLYEYLIGNAQSPPIIPPIVVKAKHALGQRSLGHEWWRPEEH